MRSFSRSSYTYTNCNFYAYCDGDENGTYDCHCLGGLTGTGLGDDGCEDVPECTGIGYKTEENITKKYIFTLK